MWGTLSDKRLHQLGGPGPRIYIPQEQGGPVIPPVTVSPTPLSHTPKFLGRKHHSSVAFQMLLIWTYGIQLWGTASTYNIEILERFQSKVLRIIVDAPWYVLNSLIRRDLRCPTVKEEIRRYSSHYGDRLRTRPNHLAVNLLRLPDNRRLRRFLPTDLPDRF
jgi:hypothetical protein